MSDDRQTPHRRRRPSAAPIPEEEPLRIIVGNEQDTPDWMVSDTSGAASRRTKKKAEPSPRAEAARPSTRGTQESQDILMMKRGSSAERTASERRTDEEPKKAKAPARKTPAKKPAKKRPMSKKARERRARKIRRTVIGSLCAVIAVVLLVVGVQAGSRLVNIKQTLDRGDGVFYPNIFVNDIPLEGKTLDEAAAVVTQQVQSLISSFRITLRTEDGRSWDITGDSLNMKYDIADQLDQLWAIGHTGSSSTRYEQVKALEAEPAMRYTTLTYDLSQVNQILNQIKAEVDQPAVSATRVQDDSKWPPFSYTDDIPGQTLDITGLNERICTMVDTLVSGDVVLSPTPVQATITRAQLEAQIVKLSSYETTVGKSGEYAEARAENVRLGTEKFNHLVIRAGESVSFNKVAGKRTVANGYQQALEIAYGNYVLGTGGGICQVSSTLYNAVVNAGLTVNKRTPHAIPSSYVEKGLDATVSDDRYDFVFTNNTNSDIYIETEFVKVKGYYHSRFTIYGRPDPNGYTYKLVSQVVETIPLPEPTYEKDTTGEYVFYDDETAVKSSGREGYIVDVYLVTMDSKGLEISREKKYTDTYKASAPVYWIGVNPHETPIPEGFESID
ncbi:MAG: VanW family protein [Clostridiales bacterium]|nr:VanW family protein [Clostridiales bacterium]